MNNVMISGRFGRDPEIRYSKSGMAVVSGTIANNVPKKDGTKKTNWIDIVAFDKTAEKIASDFSKGDQIGPGACRAASCARSCRCPRPSTRSPSSRRDHA